MLLRHSMTTVLANRRVGQTNRKLMMDHEALEGSQKAYVIFAPEQKRLISAGKNGGRGKD